MCTENLYRLRVCTTSFLYTTWQMYLMYLKPIIATKASSS